MRSRLPRGVPASVLGSGLRTGAQDGVVPAGTEEGGPVTAGATAGVAGDLATAGTVAVGATDLSSEMDGVLSSEVDGVSATGTENRARTEESRARAKDQAVRTPRKLGAPCTAVGVCAASLAGVSGFPATPLRASRRKSRRAFLTGESGVHTSVPAARPAHSWEVLVPWSGLASLAKASAPVAMSAASLKLPFLQGNSSNDSRPDEHGPRRTSPETTISGSVVPFTQSGRSDATEPDLSHLRPPARLRPADPPGEEISPTSLPRGSAAGEETALAALSSLPGVSTVGEGTSLTSLPVASTSGEETAVTALSSLPGASTVGEKTSLTALSSLPGVSTAGEGTSLSSSPGVSTSAEKTALTALTSLPGISTASTVAAERASRSDWNGAAGRMLPVVPALADLLPGAGLRRGSVIAVHDSTSLLFALLAEATAAGAWAAVVGVPSLGVVAAAEHGVAVSRLALVPRPGAEYAAVMGALLDGVDLVVTDPRSVRPEVARRLAARARNRGSVLVALGQWPAADVEFHCTPGAWAGVLDRGAGYLRSRPVEVHVRGRGAAARPRSASMLLPGQDGRVSRGGKRVAVQEEAAG